MKNPPPPLSGGGAPKKPPLSGGGAPKKPPRDGGCDRAGSTRISCSSSSSSSSSKYCIGLLVAAIGAIPIRLDSGPPPPPPPPLLRTATPRDDGRADSGRRRSRSLSLLLPLPSRSLLLLLLLRSLAATGTEADGAWPPALSAGKVKYTVAIPSWMVWITPCASFGTPCARTVGVEDFSFTLSPQLNAGVVVLAR